MKAYITPQFVSSYATHYPAAQFPKHVIQHCTSQLPPRCRATTRRVPTLHTMSSTHTHCHRLLCSVALRSAPVRHPPCHRPTTGLSRTLPTSPATMQLVLCHSTLRTTVYHIVCRAMTWDDVSRCHRSTVSVTAPEPESGEPLSLIHI